MFQNYFTTRIINCFIVTICIALIGCNRKEEKTNEKDTTSFAPVDVLEDFELHATRYIKNLDSPSQSHRDYDNRESKLIFKNNNLVRKPIPQNLDGETYFIFDSISYLDCGKVFWVQRDSTVSSTPQSEFEKKFNEKLEEAADMFGSNKVIIVLFGGSGWIETYCQKTNEGLWFGVDSVDAYVVDIDEFYEKAPEIPFVFKNQQ